jgi:hypothetical protein
MCMEWERQNFVTTTEPEALPWFSSLLRQTSYYTVYTAFVEFTAAGRYLIP